MGIGRRYLDVRAEVEAQCVACGRDPRTVRLVAVSKTVGVEGVGEALAAGAADFGENRPDQIVLKSQAWPQATWHFIGNIQSRRIPDIVASASLIHSLHQFDHARKVDEAARAIGKVQDVLIEVNVSGEASKSGVEPSQAEALVRACADLPNVRVRGLMTMAPQGDPVAVKESFAGLRNLAAQIKRGLPTEDAACFDELSMGMSEDWREAISSGATIVRIGRAIFSDNF